MSKNTGRRMQQVYDELVSRKPEPILVQDFLPNDYTHSEHVCLLNTIRRLEKKGIVVVEKVERPCKRSPSYERVHLMLRLTPEHLGTPTG